MLLTFLVLNGGQKRFKGHVGGVKLCTLSDVQIGIITDIKAVFGNIGRQAYLECNIAGGGVYMGMDLCVRYDVLAHKGFLHGCNFAAKNRVVGQIQLIADMDRIGKRRVQIFDEQCVFDLLIFDGVRQLLDADRAVDRHGYSQKQNKDQKDIDQISSFLFHGMFLRRCYGVTALMPVKAGSYFRTETISAFS